MLSPQKLPPAEFENVRHLHTHTHIHTYNYCVTGRVSYTNFEQNCTFQLHKDSKIWSSTNKCVFCYRQSSVQWLLPTSAKNMVNESNHWAQFRQHSWKLGGAPEHLSQCFIERSSYSKRPEYSYVKGAVSQGFFCFRSILRLDFRCSFVSGVSPPRKETAGRMSDQSCPWRNWKKKLIYAFSDVTSQIFTRKSNMPRKSNMRRLKNRWEKISLQKLGRWMA